jgi:hypothetical protein
MTSNPAPGSAGAPGASRRLSAHGLSVEAVPGWEVSIYRREPAPGEQTFGVLQAATVALPPLRGDFGGGVVETLGPNDVFLAVLDFGPAAAAQALFAGAGPHDLAPDDYRPRQLQRFLANQAGVQQFFNAAGRGFCLYSVIGGYSNRVALTARANQILATVRVESLR